MSSADLPVPSHRARRQKSNSSLEGMELVSSTDNGTTTTATTSLTEESPVQPRRSGRKKSNSSLEGMELLSSSDEVASPTTVQIAAAASRRSTRQRQKSNSSLEGMFSEEEFPAAAAPPRRSTRQRQKSNSSLEGMFSDEEGKENVSTAPRRSKRRPKSPSCDDDKAVAARTPTAVLEEKDAPVAPVSCLNVPPKVDEKLLVVDTRILGRKLRRMQRQRFLAMVSQQSVSLATSE